MCVCVLHVNTSLPLWNHYSWTFTLLMSSAPTSVVTDSELWSKRVWADTQKLQIIILSICQFVCRLFYLLQLKLDHFISIHRFLKCFLCLLHKRQRLNMNMLKTIKDKSELRMNLQASAALWCTLVQTLCIWFLFLVCLRGLTRLLAAARLQNTWTGKVRSFWLSCSPPLGPLSETVVSSWLASGISRCDLEWPH